jgi:hypothetical protein
MFAADPEFDVGTGTVLALALGWLLKMEFAAVLGLFIRRDHEHSIVGRGAVDPFDNPRHLGSPQRAERQRFGESNGASRRIHRPIVASQRFAWT